MSKLTDYLIDAHLLRLDFKDREGEFVRNYGLALPNIFDYMGPMVTLHSKQLFPEYIYDSADEIESARQNARASVKQQLEYAYNNQTFGVKEFTEEYIDQAIETMRGNASRPSSLLDHAENIVAAVLEDANHPILLINSIRNRDLFFITDRKHIADGKSIYDDDPNTPLRLNDIVRYGQKPAASWERIEGQYLPYPEYNKNIYTTATGYPLFDWTDRGSSQNPKINPKAIEGLRLIIAHEFNHGADFRRGEEPYSALPEVKRAIDADTKTTVERLKVFMALSFLRERAKENKNDALYDAEIKILNSPRYGHTYQIYTDFMEMSVSDLTDYVIKNRGLLYDTLNITGENSPSISKALEDDTWKRCWTICNDALKAIATEEPGYQQRGQADKTQQTIRQEAVANFASMTQKHGLEKTARLFPHMYNSIYCETIFPRIANKCQELCEKLGYIYTIPFQPPTPHTHSFSVADRDTLNNLGAKDGGADAIARARSFYRDAIKKEGLTNITNALSADNVDGDPFAISIDFGKNSGAADLFCKAATYNYIAFHRDEHANKITMTDYIAIHIVIATAEYHNGRCDRIFSLRQQLSYIQNEQFEDNQTFVFKHVLKAITLAKEQIGSLNLTKKDISYLFKFNKYFDDKEESDVRKLCETFLSYETVQGELRTIFEEMLYNFTEKTQLINNIRELKNAFKSYEGALKKGNLGLREDQETKQIRATQQSDLSHDDTRHADPYKYFEHLPNMTREVFTRIISMTDAVQDLEDEVFPNRDAIKHVAEVAASVVTGLGVLLPEPQQVFMDAQKLNAGREF
jgi:hypothetical protein